MVNESKIVSSRSLLCFMIDTVNTTNIFMHQFENEGYNQTPRGQFSLKKYV